ncbi:MAG TPA: SH3 domain-containing protein [Kiloniellaceae bacterium]|nr:SH3 domain-containing protein [Kiloniellaceae bacterium]
MLRMALRAIAASAIAAGTIVAGMIALNAWAANHSPEARGPSPKAADAASETGVAAPEDGGPRRWQVTARDGTEMRASPASDAPVIDLLADGAILSNLGCEANGSQVWCKVRPLHGRTRGYVVAEFLRPARGPDGTVPIGVDDSALRAGRGDFDASGTLSCAQVRGQPLGECAFGIARGTGGDATVVVTFSNGFKRTLFFAHGRFISADATMSGTGFDTDWRFEDGLHLIRVDDQRYALSDAAVFGD